MQGSCHRPARALLSIDAEVPVTDLEWGAQMLPKVSRTFALGITFLDEPWCQWVRTSYLLCRIADTVEDAPGLSLAARRALFDTFVGSLGSGDGSAFLALARRLPDDDEGELARGLDRVLSVYSSFPPDVRTRIARWVEEMAEGMLAYAASFDAGTPIRDEADLLRYCHFVAGTVGQLLTDLFVLGSDRVRERETELRAEAESFGLLLQLTNIAKDLEEDLARGACFVPQSILERRWVPRDELFGLFAEHRTGMVVRDLVAMAREYLPAAHRYVHALPAEELSIRRFCTLPLSLAMRTLDLLDAEPTGAVRKVDRATVMALVADVHAMGVP